MVGFDTETDKIKKANELLGDISKGIKTPTQIIGEAQAIVGGDIKVNLPSDASDEIRERYAQNSMGEVSQALIGYIKYHSAKEKRSTNIARAFQKPDKDENTGEKTEKKTYGNRSKYSSDSENFTKKPTVPDYYSDLGVRFGATTAEINKALRDKARELHVDSLKQKLKDEGLSDEEIQVRLSEAEEKFKRVTEAHAILSKQDKREKYDRQWKDYYQESASQTKTSQMKPVGYFGILGLDLNASQGDITKAFNALKDKYPPGSKEAKQISEAYFILSDPESRETARQSELKKLEKASKAPSPPQPPPTITKSAPPVDSSWKLIITFNPNLTEESSDWNDMKDSVDRAKEDTKIFRENANSSGLIKFSKKEIEELKKIGAIPQNATDLEAQSILTTSHRIYANGGTSKDLLAAITNNKNITETQRAGFFEPVTANVAALEKSDYFLTKNLRLANGNPSIQILNPSELTSKFQGLNQIILKLQNNYLTPIFEKVKSLGINGMANIKNFITKSLTSKTAKKVFESVAKLGLKAGLEALESLAASAILPGIGTVVEALLKVGKILLKIVGKLLEKLLGKLKKTIDENAKWLALVGFGGLILGAAGLGSLATAIGLFSLGTLFLLGGFPLIMGGTAAAVGMFFPFIMPVAPLVIISAWFLVGIIAFTLLTIFVLFIINSGGYIIPAQFETGIGYTPSDCLGSPPPKPEAQGVRYSADGKYAFPVSNGGAPDACYHWDYPNASEYATDLWSATHRVPLVAYESGKIVNVTLNDSKGGKYVILEGDSGRFYYYAHNCHVFVTPGQSVNVGEVIATMDETGNGRVEHLHFAIDHDDNFVGGAGDVCPYEDFEEKFSFDKCEGGLFGNLWCTPESLKQ